MNQKIIWTIDASDICCSLFTESMDLILKCHVNSAVALGLPDSQGNQYKNGCFRWREDSPERWSFRKGGPAMPGC